MNDKVYENFKELLETLHINILVVEEDGKIKVKSGLYLDNTNITSLPDNLTVEGTLDLSNTNIATLPDNLTVGGTLDLSNTNITSLPDNLTVGGYLDLSDSNITSLPDNLTVGGGLDLRNTNITSLPDNLMVGDTVYGFNSETVSSIKKLTNGFNKERKFIYFDGILWSNVKSVKKVDNITIYKTPIGCCVEEDGLTAHGKTLKQAMENLTFKKIKNKDVSDIVREIKESGKVNREQYRAITGACQFGTEQFCNHHNIEDLEEIELEELRKILVNDYGAEKFWELIDNEM